VNYYKITADVGRVNTLTSVKIGDNITLTTVANGETWSSITATARTTGVQPATGFTITAMPTAASSTIQYGKSSSNTTEPTWGDTSTIIFDNNDYLGIKVTSDGGSVRFYKIRLTIPTFEITKQPVGATYNVSDTFVPLTVEVTDGATVTYQWVSWSSYTATGNGTNVTGASFSGQTTNSLTISTASTNSGNYYACRITGGGVTLTSDRVPVIVTAANAVKAVLVDLSKVTDSLINTDPITTQYGSFNINLPAEAFPEGFDITKYTRFTVSVDFYGPAMELRTYNWGRGGMAFLADSATLLERWNLGMAPTTNHSLKASKPDAIDTNDLDTPLDGKTPTAIRLSSMHPTDNANFCAYIRLREIRFTP